MRNSLKVILSGLVIAALILAGCRQEQATPEEILAEAADTMAAIETLEFTIDREGDPILLSEELGASLLSVEGVYRDPGDVFATARVEISGLVAEAEILWLESGALYRLPPMIPDWTQLVIAFEASDIFDDEVGLPAILRGLENPELVGEEDVEGVEAHHITAAAKGEDIANLVGGAVAPGPVTVDVWVDQKTSEVVQVSVTEETGDMWLLYLYSFGAEVDIPTP
nr:LppX_LprAFG lipoprotein [Anaerolineae bacterium]